MIPYLWSKRLSFQNPIWRINLRLKLFIAMSWLMMTTAMQGFANSAYVTSTTPTISVIDTDTNLVVDAIIDTNTPSYVAITPDGSYAYVSNFGANEVIVIDTATNVVTTTISGSFNSPFGIAFTPDGTTAYVCNRDGDNVAVIDVETNVVTTLIAVGSSPRTCAVLPNGSYLYVTNASSNTVSVIDTSTNTVVGTISVGSTPNGIVILPNGDFAYVSNNGDNTVSVIATATNTVVATISVGNNPRFLCASADGSMVYVPNQDSQNISFIDTNDNLVTSTVTIAGSTPYASAYHGGILYVTDFTLNVVYVIDASTGIVTDTIAVAVNPTSIAITPDAPLPVQPPLALYGFRTKNRFLTQSDLINVISWVAPSDGPSPVSYLIYRNSLSELIGTVSANEPLKFFDHNRKKNKKYTYYVISVDESGQRSSPATVIIFS